MRDINLQQEIDKFLFQTSDLFEFQRVEIWRKDHQSHEPYCLYFKSLENKLYEEKYILRSSFIRSRLKLSLTLCNLLSISAKNTMLLNGDFFPLSNQEDDTEPEVMVRTAIGLKLIENKRNNDYIYLIGYCRDMFAYDEEKLHYIIEDSQHIIEIIPHLPRVNKEEEARVEYDSEDIEEAAEATIDELDEKHYLPEHTVVTPAITPLCTPRSITSQHLINATVVLQSDSISELGEEEDGLDEEDEEEEDDEEEERERSFPHRTTAAATAGTGDALDEKHFAPVHVITPIGTPMGTPRGTPRGQGSTLHVLETLVKLQREKENRAKMSQDSAGDSAGHSEEENDEDSDSEDSEEEEEDDELDKKHYLPSHPVTPSITPLTTPRPGYTHTTNIYQQPLDQERDKYDQEDDQEEDSTASVASVVAATATQFHASVRTIVLQLLAKEGDTATTTAILSSVLPLPPVPVPEVPVVPSLPLPSTTVPLLPLPLPLPPRSGEVDTEVPHTDTNKQGMVTTTTTVTTTTAAAATGNSSSCHSATTKTKRAVHIPLLPLQSMLLPSLPSPLPSPVPPSSHGMTVLAQSNHPNHVNHQNHQMITALPSSDSTTTEVHKEVYKEVVHHCEENELDKKQHRWMPTYVPTPRRPPPVVSTGSSSSMQQLPEPSPRSILTTRSSSQSPSLSARGGGEKLKKNVSFSFETSPRLITTTTTTASPTSVVGNLTPPLVLL